jgi:hypothetical protein
VVVVVVELEALRVEGLVMVQVGSVNLQDDSPSSVQDDWD